jgi:hypothetical protein
MNIEERWKRKRYKEKKRDTNEENIEKIELHKMKEREKSREEIRKAILE